jgi:hypothetical protein
MSSSLIQGALPIVNRIDQETEKEVRAHKGCRAIQEEEQKVQKPFWLFDYFYASTARCWALAAFTAS